MFRLSRYSSECTAMLALGHLWPYIDSVVQARWIADSHLAFDASRWQRSRRHIYDIIHVLLVVLSSKRRVPKVHTYSDYWSSEPPVHRSDCATSMVVLHKLGPYVKINPPSYKDGQHTCTSFVKDDNDRSSSREYMSIELIKLSIKWGFFERAYMATSAVTSPNSLYLYTAKQARPNRLSGAQLSRI